MTSPLLTFFGDDFTGSTDAMEVLTLAGVPTVLFTAAPTPVQIERAGAVTAVGVAGTTRSMPPDAMEHTLRPALASLLALRAPIVHYKVCSTFDSSPTVGSIGRVVEIASDLSGAGVPIVAGAPSLGRYCVFAHLFAVMGDAPEVHRLDRHPSMRRHPVTPMDESDLRRHLARQTRLPVGLLDVRQLDGDRNRAIDAYRRLASDHPAVLIDLLHDRQLATVGALLMADATSDRPVIAIGSSGVESALWAYWSEIGVLGNAPAPAAAAPATGPILVVAGSCSPVTKRQVEWAAGNGFDIVPMNEDDRDAIDTLARILESGRDAVLHSRGTDQEHRVDASGAAGIGSRLGRIARAVLERRRAPRMCVAGGDTSGAVAAALGIESVRMIAPLVRGAPLCVITAPDSPADGMQVVFKGGQIGPVDFFGMLR